MSTTSQLEAWAARHIADFYGVFSADTLPKPIIFVNSTPTALIVNYDLHKMPGSHWVAVYATKNTLAWFDSFGLAPDADDLILKHKTYFRQWLERVCQQLGLKKYGYNTADLQSLPETTCGHYSLWFAKNGPEKGWECFGPDRRKNDLLIRKLVRL